MATRALSKLRGGCYSSFRVLYLVLFLTTREGKVRFIADVLRNFASAACETKTEKTCNSRHIATNWDTIVYLPWKSLRTKGIALVFAIKHSKSAASNLLWIKNKFFHTGSEPARMWPMLKSSSRRHRFKFDLHQTLSLGKPLHQLIMCNGNAAP